jgi:hypothetical protein
MSEYQNDLTVINAAEIKTKEAVTAIKVKKVQPITFHRFGLMGSPHNFILQRQIAFMPN